MEKTSHKPWYMKATAKEQKKAFNRDQKTAEEIVTEFLRCIKNQ